MPFIAFIFKNTHCSKHVYWSHSTQGIFLFFYFFYLKFVFPTTNISCVLTYWNSTWFIISLQEGSSMKETGRTQKKKKKKNMVQLDHIQVALYAIKQSKHCCHDTYRNSCLKFSIQYHHEKNKSISLHYTVNTRN